MSSDIRFIAKQYIDAGWAVVPLVKGAKRANTSWQKKTYSPNDFNASDGIAGKCGEASGWRVDVDCDCPEAIVCARMLLPATGLTHGRPSKPDSHYWFICEKIKTTQFTDIRDTAGKSGMLIEIRSSGGYTALPPSFHPSGEQLAWACERDPMTLSPEELYNVVVAVAIATLMARHWPVSGVRHAAVGHLTGFLLQGGVDPMMVPKIIEAAATAAKDPDVQDRVKFAHNTCAKYANGESVSGGPKLAAEVGEELVSKMRGWLKMADADAIEEMNTRHFLVRIGKDELIGTEDGDEVIFQYKGSLDLRYANRKIISGVDDNGKPKLQPLMSAWIESKIRREYRTVVFAPPPQQPDPRDYNLWKGFAVTPEAGEPPELLMDHILQVICDGNEEHALYLLKLLAYMVQCPGVPSEVAVVLRGEPGTGKGIFVRALSRIFGKHAAHLDKVDQLVGHFNSLLSAKVLVFADEAFWAGDKREIGALKRLITEPTLTIERKGIDATQEKNCVHLFMATNEEWAIPAMMRERRFFALNVSSTKRQDIPYFQALTKEMDEGGLGRFLHFLLTLSVSKDEVLNVPKTKELRIQQDQSLAPEMKWWQECLSDGFIGPTAWEKYDDWITCANLYLHYTTWMKDHAGRVLDKIEFGRRLAKFISTDKSKPHRFSGNVERAWNLRSLADARKVFDDALGTSNDWQDAPSASQGNVPF